MDPAKNFRLKAGMVLPGRPSTFSVNDAADPEARRLGYHWTPDVADFRTRPS